LSVDAASIARKAPCVSSSSLPPQANREENVHMAKQPDLPTPSHVRNMRLIGHSDQGGRPDGQQIMVHKGYAYIGHVCSQGFSIVDVRDPRNPNTVRYVANPPNTWSLHLQVYDDLLLLVHARDMFSMPEMADERNYYKGNADFSSLAKPPTERDWSAGMAVFDISNPTEPRQIGFLPVAGRGLHRIWYVGGRWAYASALFDGFTDYILIVIDMADPTHPVIAGRYWLPGMNAAAGEKPNWPLEHGRYGLHHAIVDGDTAYCSWRDACLVVVDVADRNNPKLISHQRWFPPIGGGTHNALPLPDRDLLIILDEAVLDEVADGYKPIWVFDNKIKRAPVCISTFPMPIDRDYIAVGGHFGPHNVHENRPGSFQSSELIFATYQNAGVRVYDIRNSYQPVEIAACVPPAPTKLMDPRPNRPVVLHSADVFVDRNGIVYCTDWSGAGLHIIEYTG
jgi:hypothetical protein